MADTILLDDWLTFKEAGAKVRERLGHGSADAFRRWKREGRLEEYGFELRYVGRTPLVRSRPETKTAS
jgi:hypothetical protein